MIDALEGEVRTEERTIEFDLCWVELNFNALTMSRLHHADAVLIGLANSQARLRRSFLSQGRLFGFQSDGLHYRIKVEFHYLNDIQISDGSIRAKFKVCLVALGTVYTGVATYPTFKEGAEILYADFRAGYESVIKYTLDAYRSQTEEDQRRQQDVVTIDVVGIREEEILESIKKQLR